MRPAEIANAPALEAHFDALPAVPRRSSRGRRTKSEVLAELPARAEVTLRIALEADEARRYGAVRREALDRLRTSTRRIDLASLMRLRRAGSNRRMVLPGSSSPSAKLAALDELLDELLPSGHKALVFGQFVDHLALVRELPGARGTTYRYLDGSTSSGARKPAVTAFQSGQGDVFLISPKAGGFGLNLTAADFVIHMDPWWNPASEDQASDRARRVGQSRPVTIYRLVAAETIEDKILELHHRKRELAASLLEGGEQAASLDDRELLALIREA